MTSSVVTRFIRTWREVVPTTSGKNEETAFLSGRRLERDERGGSEF
jgi:hypothetical protein